MAGLFPAFGAAVWGGDVWDSDSHLQPRNKPEDGGPHAEGGTGRCGKWLLLDDTVMLLK